MSKFSERTNYLRTKNHKTLQQVSFATDISIPTLCSYEHDKHSASLSAVIILADYYEVSLDYLVGRDKYVQPKIHKPAK